MVNLSIWLFVRCSVNDISRLFRLLAPSQSKGPAVARDATKDAEKNTLRHCVVWRAQNIASRHGNKSESRHHPSSLNGVHHWLNRISIALARQHGLRVVDLSEVTMAHAPLAHSVDGAGWMAATRDVDALEGDAYHGYHMGLLGPLFLEALSEACC